MSSQLHAPSTFPPSIHLIGGWVGPRAGLDAVVRREYPIIAPTENQTPVIQPVSYPSSMIHQANI